MKPSNAHANHPERVVEKCLLTECGKMHLPYTNLAREHKRRAIRRREFDAGSSPVLYAAIVNAPTIREARKIAMDMWRAVNEK